MCCILYSVLYIIQCVVYYTVCCISYIVLYIIQCVVYDTVCCIWYSVLYIIQCVVYYTVCCILYSVLYIIQCVVYYTVCCILYSVLYIIQCVVYYTMCCILYSVLYIIQCVVYYTVCSPFFHQCRLFPFRLKIATMEFTHLPPTCYCSPDKSHKNMTQPLNSSTSQSIHLTLVTANGITECGENWLRLWWPVDCLVPSHYPNQCWQLFNVAIMNKSACNFMENLSISNTSEDFLKS